jgi:hypothetical protein
VADRIVLNTPRYKGEYEFDIETEPLTNLEWRWIKKISGYLPLTIDEGWRGGDPDLFVAFAVVALARAGKIQQAEALIVAESFGDLPFDGAAITVIGDKTEEGEEIPPAEPAATPGTEQPLRSIGASSKSTSDPLDSRPSRTGVHA